MQATLSLIQCPFLKVWVSPGKPQEMDNAAKGGSLYMCVHVCVCVRAHVRVCIPSHASMIAGEGEKQCGHST